MSEQHKPPRKPRFALRFTTDGNFELYTDADNLEVLSIDDNAPHDRVCEFSPINRLTPVEFDTLIGTDPIQRLGDKRAIEHAARGFFSRIIGRPRLHLVKSDRS